MSEFVKISLPESEKAKFRAWTEKQSVEAKKEIRQSVYAAVSKTHRLAQSFAPAPTGFLKGGLHPVYQSDGLGGAVYNQRN
jgi:hypothetical protein